MSPENSEGGSPLSALTWSAIAVSVVSAIVSAAFAAFNEALGKEVLFFLALVIVCGILACWGCQILTRKANRYAMDRYVQDPAQKQWHYSGRQRAAGGALVSLGAVGVLVFSVGVFNLSRSTLKKIEEGVKKGFHPERVVLTSSKQTIAIGDSVDLTLKVGDEAVRSNWSCKWITEPEQGYWDPPVGKPMTITPKVDLKRGDQPKTLKISVTVFNDQSEKVGSDQTTIEVRYRPTATLQADPDILYTDASTMLRAFVDGAPPGPTCRFEWSVNDGMTKPSKTSVPQFPYKPAEEVLQGSSTKSIEITLKVSEGEEVLLPATIKITVRKREAVTLDFAVDVSERMWTPIKTISPFDLARREIINSLFKASLVGGYVGIEVFGEGPGGAIRDPCQWTRSAVPMGPLNLSDVQNSLQLIQQQSAVDRAPLLLGIKKAVSNLALRAPQGRGELVIITGGPDTCDPKAQNPAAYLKEIQEMFKQQDFRTPWTSFRVLTPTAAIVRSRDDEQYWQQVISSNDYAEFPHLICLCHSEQGVAKLLNASVNLLSADPNVARQAAEDLSAVYAVQKDRFARQRIARFVGGL